MLTSIAIFVGYNLLNGARGGIDNAAHIGGLISGIVIGYAFYPGLVKPDKEKLKHITTGDDNACGIFLFFLHLPAYSK